MEWLSNNSSIIIAAGSLAVSIIAFVKSSIATSNTVKLQRMIKLSDFHDEAMLGRQAMETIFCNWSKISNKHDIEDLCEEDIIDFISFYNDDYHHGSDNTKKCLSNEVHRYLSRLHHLWLDAHNNVFNIKEIMQKFGDGVCMDETYILLYLRAHLEAHRGKTFWQGIPSIIETAKKWQSIRKGAISTTKRIKEFSR